MEITEAVPLAVAALLAAVAAHWLLFAKRSETPRRQRRPTNMRDVSEEAVLELAALVPNVPMDVVRDEVRSAATMDAAAEALFVLAAEYPDEPAPRPVHPRVASPVDARDVPPPQAVDAATWTRDKDVRDTLFRQRKAYILQEARKRYLSRKSS